MNSSVSLISIYNHLNNSRRSDSKLNEFNQVQTKQIQATSHRQINVCSFQNPN